MRKSIQITMDYSLLTEFDEDEQVKLEGRSSVIRKVLRRYLAEQQAARIREAYQKGYGTLEGGGVCEELEGWEKEQVWPE